ncbi:MAG TPA: D-aminoacylase [Blastocatellia bacterium]|jgi:N-acyl-D-amino-acid deacylase|nr:D-aminoacylase [Blastocatellia bacterium]
MYDITIQNAVIIDGAGLPAFRADVAIKGDRIAAIGNLNAKAKRTINARGLTVIPGIIDSHSHADLILPLAPKRQTELMRCKLAQGVTTIIIGNCGLGCAPVANEDAEGILRAVNAWMTPESVEWRWRTIGEYLDRIESNGLAMNIATLAPHGPVRISAMGLAKGVPSKSQMKKMRAMVERAMMDGALGLSTGLIYPPGMYSDTSELKELARVVADYGGVYTSHIRGSSETLIPAVKELLEVGRETGVRVHHSHNEAVGREHWPKIDRVLAMEEEAERDGLRVSFDMFPYTAAATMMIAIYPPWSLEGGVDRLIERLKDQKIRLRIERDIERKKPSWPPWRERGWPHNLVGATSWDSIFIGYVESRRNKRYEKRSLAELAQLTGKRPFDAISDLIIEERGQVSMLIFEISGEGEERELLGKYARHRLSAFCTDAEDYGRGLPHPAAYGAFAHILSKYVREDRALTLEEAVRKMTSYPARIFALKDRGAIRPGAFADLTIFDPGRVNDRASFEKPRREATGIKLVIVNGRVAFENNQAMDNLHGAVIRNGV